jgi:magnesium-transporting ATPase (P-type)
MSQKANSSQRKGENELWTIEEKRWAGAAVIVVVVGETTELGKVATELQSVTNRKSPLQVKIDELGHQCPVSRSSYFVDASLKISN